MPPEPVSTRTEPWRRLLQSNVPAAGVGFKSARNIVGVNRSAAGFGVYIAFYPVNVDIAGAGLGVHPVTDGGNLQASGAGADFERTSNPLHSLVAGAALDTQVGLRWNHHYVADGNVVPQFRIVDVADTDIVAALLDGRVRLQPLDLLLDVSCKPFRSSDVSRYLYLARIAGAHFDTARAGGQIQMHRPGHLQSTLE